MYDLAVIGAGPGGYVAALRAAQLGKRVVVIDEEGKPGGTCLNWGCIPSKALLRSAEVYELLKDVESLGVHGSQAGFDMKRIVARSRDVVTKLNCGIEFLLKKNKVEYLPGRAKILSGGTVGVSGRAEPVNASRILVATGSTARTLPGVKPDGLRILTAREAMLMETPPESVAVLGAGAIGIEFAYYFHALGAHVTVIELLDRVLPSEDPEVSERVKKAHERRGMKFLLRTRVTAMTPGPSGVQIETECDGRPDRLSASTTLMAFGVQPNLDGLFADGMTPALERGWIAVDDDFRTSMDGVYAIGDVTGPPQLAHVASHEGIIAVERMFTDSKPVMQYDAIPMCTYAHPQTASIGLAEPAAREKFGDGVQIGRFPFQALGKAVASGETDGFLKLVFAGPDARLVGAHIVGAGATEMIAELGMALALRATRDNILSVIHAHPTMSEAVTEAALAAAGRALHT